jgi:hypothetical protein
VKTLIAVKNFTDLYLVSSPKTEDFSSAFAEMTHYSDQNSSGMISLALSVAIRGRNTEAVQAIISSLALLKDEALALEIFEPVLQSFSFEDREWFDNLRSSTNWEDLTVDNQES